MAAAAASRAEIAASMARAVCSEGQKESFTFMHTPSENHNTTRSKHAAHRAPTCHEDEVVKGGKHRRARLVDGHEHGVALPAQLLQGLHHLQEVSERG